MANTDNNTIQLSVGASSPYIEAIAGNTILPGQLLQFTSIGTVIQHNVAVGPAERLFAVENVYRGGTIEDYYYAGDTVLIRVCRPGDIILAWLTSNLASLPAGEYMHSHGATDPGYLSTGGVSPLPQCYVGVMMEDMAGSTEYQRLKIRVF